MPIAKLDLFRRSDAVKRVFESVAAALPEKRIAAATTDNRTNVTKGMRDGGVGRYSCAAAHMLNGVIKSTMKRVNSSSVDMLPRALRAV